MMVTAKGRYALRMMLDMALQPEEACVSLRDISSRQDISVKYLEQIAVQLTKAGLLRSVRGAQGGYLMAKRPHACTAGEVLRAVEGKLAPTEAPVGEQPAHENSVSCAAAGFWEGFDHAVNAYVDGVTLQDMLDAQAARGYDYSI